MPESIELLLIEDSPSDAATLIALLSRSKSPRIDIRHLTRLDEACLFLDAHSVDLIVLDLGLPDARELEGVERLAVQYSGIPLVVLTGVDDDGIALNAIHSGAQDFVTKGSVDRHALIRIFRYAIERHQNQKRLASLTDELKLVNASLARLSVLDPLTELLNRRGLQQCINDQLEVMRNSGVPVLTLLIDIDDFKRINETLGHAAGDVALKEVAQKIRGCLRGADFVARIGGDEFMAIMPRADPAEAVRIAERVRLKIATVVLQAGSGTLGVTASIGAVMLSADTPSIDELLMRTQQILHRSKSTGKNKVSYAGAEFDDTARRLADEKDMVTALSRGRHLYSVRQPIHDLRTLEVIGYEYLSRYGNPPEAMPDSFFRVCAEQNVLTLVDHHCLRSAMEQSRGVPVDLRRHINVFPSTLLAVPVEHMLAEFPPGIPPSSYCIEISESQIIGDPSYLLEPVSGLRAAGVKIAIDDVGFGNSCLESLIFLEPDIIKLDKRCGRGIGEDESKANYLRRFMTIASELSNEVILEGIETEADLIVARDLGVRYGQGYYWGMPTSESVDDRRS